MIIPYENLNNRKSDARQSLIEAENILENGWQRRNYPVVDLKKTIPWNLANQSERSWNFYIHSWDMLDALLYAYSLNSDEIILKSVLKIVLDWIELYVDLDKSIPIHDKNKTDFAWYDMAVGLRSYRLAYIYDAYRSSSHSLNENSEKIWKSLVAHQAFLEPDEHIIFHNNHGYYQAAGQIAMGRRFAKDSAVMSIALKQGVARFKKMLLQQFTDEGVHREHSPDYHRMVYKTLSAMIKSGLVEDNEVIRLTYKIEKALSWFVLPNRHIVNFGDSDARYIGSKPTNNQWLTPEMDYVTTNGLVGRIERETLKVFNQAGYFIVRNGINQKDSKFQDYSYLAQTAAFHSRTHKHADDLSFVWYDRSRSILIDAGRYGYVGKAEIGTELWKQGYWYTHPHRIYCESTRAHNTLEFDGKNYPRKGVKPYGSAIGRSKVYDNGLTVLETETKNFKTIRRVRVIIYLPNQWLITFDWFKDNLNENHSIRQWFNFAPDIRTKKNGNSYEAKFNDGEELYISNLLDGVEASKVMRGVESPRLQGWYSASEKDFVPIDSFNYKLEGSSSASIATLFTFSNIKKINLANNNVSNSGRRLKVSWIDNLGNHTVFLNREEGREICVNYKFDFNRIITSNKKLLEDQINRGFNFNPYQDINIKDTVRLVIYDYVVQDFVLYKIIEPYEEFYMPYEKLTNPEKSKYKYQVKNRITGRWVDTQYKYCNLFSKEIN
ncbi:heparinase II/III domain-containing protein [Psychrobacter celer]|uniref:heparinase II/III domain-containing protein n=1 Tax=Psychrobacter celer TaxID=306572 RepID=UPI003FD45B20